MYALVLLGKFELFKVSQDMIHCTCHCIGDKFIKRSDPTDNTNHRESLSHVKILMPEK